MEIDQREIDSIIENINKMIEINKNIKITDDSTARFSSALWYNEVQNLNILIAGVGGIGSWTALLISRLHPKNLVLIDSDTVEIHNLSGQLYGLSNVNKYKVDAMSEIIKDFSNYPKTMAVNENFTENSEPYDIMICGFDNMAARKLYFKKWLELVKKRNDLDRKNCLFIDGRLNAEKFQVLSIVGDDYYSMGKYAKDFLFDDSEVIDGICSYKQTSYCAAMIGSFICNTLVNFACHNNDERPVLFFQEYDAQSLTLKQEC